MLNEKYLKLAENLKTKFPNTTVLVEEPMSKHTTFKIGGPADIYVEPVTADIVPIINYLSECDTEYMVIGNGSNIWFPMMELREWLFLLEEKQEK